ncbi:MAG: OB-fold nucleic acid binding domain-containing protein, partial [Chloroflexota bacterium]|nr:OB-fold nucleic acid binding domain-containing protein [Chloroflexota bacterium]
PSHEPPDGSVISIADARAAAKNARVTVRGVVTLASGTIDPGSAVIQDASGAIVLRLGDDARTVSLGELVEVDGVRSTKEGMETLRVVVAPRRLGTAPDPATRTLRTGDASEASEAHLVVVRGALVASARRASSGTVSFELDDGSGPLRVAVGAGLELDNDPLAAGTWIEVSGVLGQATTGAQPLRGYRVWPRSAADLRILAGATDASASAARSGSRSAAAGAAGSAGTTGDGGGSAVGVASTLAALDEAGLSDIRVGATLVASVWPELGVAGLLWDGVRLVGVAPSSSERLDPTVSGRATPLSLELIGLREVEAEPESGLPLVVLGERQGDTVLGSGPAATPASAMPGPGDPPTWVSVVGSVTGSDDRRAVEVGGSAVELEQLCDGDARTDLPGGTVMLVGVAVADPARLLIGCDGVRPAPALALLAARAAEQSTSGSTAATTVDAAVEATAGRHPLAVVLLGAGVAILLGAVAVVRRYGTALPGEPQPGERSANPSDADPESTPPQLTLVPVPNERAP